MHAVWLYNPQRKKRPFSKIAKAMASPYVIVKRINDLIYRIQLGPQELCDLTYCGNTTERILLAGWSPLGLILLSLWSLLRPHVMTKCNLIWELWTLPARMKPLATPLLLGSLFQLLLMVSHHPREVLVYVKTWTIWKWSPGTGDLEGGGSVTVQALSDWFIYPLDKRELQIFLELCSLALWSISACSYLN